MNTFEDTFLSFIEYLKNTPVVEDEWYLANFRDENINTMACEEAFSHLNFTIEYLMREKDESITYEIIEILLSLVRQSKTKQIPSALTLHRNDLINRLSNDEYAKSKINEILRFYRLI